MQTGSENGAESLVRDRESETEEEGLQLGTLYCNIFKLRTRQDGKGIVGEKGQKDAVVEVTYSIVRNLVTALKVQVGQVRALAS
jgi:hypothetical protein